MEKEKNSPENLHINWYPGHMKKTREQIIENIRLVDAAVELVDARAPYSSSNPDIEEILGNLPKVLVLNKADLANDEKTQEWLSYYRKKKQECTAVNAMNGSGIRELLISLERQSSLLYKKLEEKGRRRRALRILIVGIPNVGKSSLINRIVGKKSARTGDRPGVTKGKQWIKLKGDMELLDTPGVLWPKIEDPYAALKLAFLGSIKDQTMETEEIMARLMNFLKERDPEIYRQRFGIEVSELTSLEALMDAIAQKRGYMLSGARVDYARLANAFLIDFRSGKLGKITLETPEEISV